MKEVSKPSMGCVLFSAFCIFYVVRKHPYLGTVIALDSIDVKNIFSKNYIHIYLLTVEINIAF